MKISKWSIFSAALFTLVAIIYVLPNFVNSRTNFLPNQKINLGLDLQGGSHLLLQVDFDNYLLDFTNSVASTLRKQLKLKKVGYRNFTVAKNSINLELRRPEQQKLLQQILHSIDMNLAVNHQDGKYSIFYNQYALTQLQDKVIDQSIEIIRMRVDSSGTTEPNIQRQGIDNILLQVPGSNNPGELKRVLGKTAKLSIHLVKQVYDSTQQKVAAKPGQLAVHGENNQLFILNQQPIITGENLNNAQAQFQNAKPVVHFSLDNLGAKKFAEVTSKYYQHRLAIVLDDRVLSAPVINEPITGGSGVISGNFSVESATELALMLRAGALPAPLKIIEERSIGPNLGADSIEAGKTAALVGFVLVILFMLVAYGVMGIFANITLVIALVYIMALLSILQATLTLPGIAGIILTIGMAVDANVLIYERIREELAKGNSNLYAVKVGFASAFATITDSNITTLIAAFLLYSFGVGAIKGFAVTLTIGIIASMYTSLVLTKLMIDLWLKFYKPRKLGLL